MPSSETIPVAEDRLLRVGEVARLLTVSPRTVWRLTADGELAYPLEIGGSRRWRESDVLAFLEARARKAAAETKRRMS